MHTQTKLQRLGRLIGWVLLILNFSAIVFIWSYTSAQLAVSSGYGLLISLGQLTGLLAAGGALLQFMLMGRIMWVEQAFGLEALAKIHRYNGYFTLGVIIAHPILLVFGYALSSQTPVLTQYFTFLTQFEDVFKALIAEVLFILVVASSIYIVRKHLPYERWHLIHLMVYAAIILAFGHQLNVGTSFFGHPLIVAYWYGIYAFVAINVGVWRFALPSYNFLKFRFHVEELVTETKDTISVYIGGKDLSRFKARPGQFVIIWVLKPGFWFEQHPFSLSALPNQKHLRLTIKGVGDYTRRIHRLKPGDRVLIYGPFGTFTPSTSGRKRLYVAGGVGITPLRSMIEAEVPAAGSTLIYGVRSKDDIILQRELEELARPRGLTIHYVFSQETDPKLHLGFVTIDLIRSLCPDVMTRDVYLCGPPVMMHQLGPALMAAGLPKPQFHAERFALHPVA